MSDQNLYSIKDFCKRNALSHTQFYELLEEHPDILKTVSVPYYKGVSLLHQKLMQHGMIMSEAMLRLHHDC